MSTALHQWFIRVIETFAPPAYKAERHTLYQTLLTLPQPVDTPQVDDLAGFVLAQIVATHRLHATAAAAQASGPRNAHTTWYAKERQRLSKLLGQIAESPVVAAFGFTIEYYAVEDVTCPHGRNRKTCEEQYALALTLLMLERYPGQGIVRKQIERLRQREPWLPALQELCRPQESTEDTLTEAVETAFDRTVSPDERTTYLLGTVVNRLRQAGWTVAQSCRLVEQILTCCFGRPDPSGTRLASLIEQWRRFG